MTADELKSEIAAHRFPYRPVWIGHLTPGGELTAIVEDTELRRLYKWPECTAWRKPLPGGGESEARVEPVRPAVKAEGVVKQRSLW